MQEPDGLQEGLSRLHFADFLGGERFRQHYDARHFPQVRLLLVVGVMVVIGVTLAGIYHHDVTLLTAAFNLGVMLPLLLATLVATGHAGWRHLYQPLLTATALFVGLLVTSLTLRASLNGTPSYFGGEVAFLFVVWLALGLRFGYAATAAVAVSLAYAWGLVNWTFTGSEVMFQCLLLLAVNVVGALCCWQLETTTRRAFRDKSILENQAEQDGLTGLYNRRAFDSHMERIFKQSRRDHGQLTVMMFDVDDFKAFNDMYGHQAGDDALKRVARVIAAGGQRPLDFAARYGGEEFSLVLYGLATEAGRNLPEQIRRKVEALHIPHARSSTGPWLTVSVGVAIVAPSAERSLAGAIQMADEALYQAKEDGRNRVVVKESRLTHMETGRFRMARHASG